MDEFNYNTGRKVDVAEAPTRWQKTKKRWGRFFQALVEEAGPRVFETFAVFLPASIFLFTVHAAIVAWLSPRTGHFFDPNPTPFSEAIKPWKHPWFMALWLQVAFGIVCFATAEAMEKVGHYLKKDY